MRPAFMGARILPGAGMAPSDPDFANVVLLLHGEGSNGSTTILDSSSFAKTVTATGGAAISTASSKFGAGSILGGGGYINASVGADGLMAGNFTIEFFAYPVGTQVFFMSGSGYLYNGLYQSYGGTSLSLPTGTVNVWHHYAISRTSGVMRSFLDGSLIDTVSYSGNVDLQSIAFGRYIPNNNLYFTGNYDEIRVTKGVGRYTAAFTPPTAAFPDA